MRFLILSCLLLVFTSPVVAEPYIGVGVGAGFLKADFTGLGGEQLDESTTSIKVNGGYAFNRYFAVEAGYAAEDLRLLRDLADALAPLSQPAGDNSP